MQNATLPSVFAPIIEGEIDLTSTLSFLLIAELCGENAL